jgi:hypothetical protein
MSAMVKLVPEGRRRLIQISMITAICVFANFLLQGHQGFSLSDQGAFWYGAQRVMVGGVPIRDFMSYDIGRYYWVASFMSLLNDNGIVALRIACVIFEAMALCTGLAMLAHYSKKPDLLYWFLAALILIVWMTPQYSLIDSSLPVILVCTLSFLVERPTGRRYFLAGVIVGLMAVFGRNHGIYGVAGSFGVMIYLNSRHKSGPSLAQAFATWLSGVVTGYLPVLLFLAFVPGFAQAFWGSFPFLFGSSATPLSLPVPWPWRVRFGEVPIADVLGDLLVGGLFIGVVLFGVLGIFWLIRNRLQDKPTPMLVASIFLALPYAEYAYSRADKDHLAIGIIPILMGVFALLANQPARLKWSFVVLIGGASLLVMLPAQPWWQCYSNPQCTYSRVARDWIKVDRETADTLEGLKGLAEQFSPGDRTFIVAPFWPGAYAVLGRKAPMWQIFGLFPQSVVSQNAEIERIKAANPGFAVINDFALDGRDDLRFQNTNPIIDQYIRDNFDPVAISTPSSPTRIYINRRARK